jgi:hypothetical protein
VKVHRILNPWSEDTVTWASFNRAFDPTAAASFSNNAQNGRVSFDATNLVQSWLSGTANNGILLEADESPLTSFHTSESDDVDVEHPALELCYTVPEL